MRELDIVRDPNFIFGEHFIGFPKCSIVRAQLRMRCAIGHRTVFFRHFPVPLSFLGVVHLICPLGASN